MENTNLHRLGALLALLVLCSASSPAEESPDYVVAVGNETLSFVACPQRGYVLKAAPNSGNVGILAAMLFMAGGDVTPIRGLDRQGIWVVENKYPAAENENTIGLLTTNSQVQYAAPLFSSNGETVAIIPEIVVRVKPGTQVELLRTICETAGCAIKKRMEFTEVEYLLEVLGPDADAVFAAVEQLNEVTFVEWACPNAASRLHLGGQTVFAAARARAKDSAQAAGASDASGVFPNDEYFPMQWHLHNTGQFGYKPDADINALEAWEITTGDPNIVVAVCDTGVDLKHPDLVNNLVPGYDFYDGDDDPSPALGDDETHGTMCAGFISAEGNNDIGVTGVAWKCKIMPIRMRIFTNIPRSAVADGIRWAAANGADILNHSWGTYNSIPIIHSAIVDVTKPGGIGRDGKGCIVIACAHNTNGNVHNPAAFPEVIAVGATNGNDERWDYSCHGPELDIMAPSGNIQAPWTLGIWTTDITGIGGWSSYNTDPNILDYVEGCGGTSVSAPIAAGVAALILSVEPDLTNEEVRHFLERSAKDLGDPGWDQYYGWGRVDARAAVELAMAARADLNDDYRVDLRDFARLAQYWMQDEASVDIYPPPRGDGVIDVRDVVTMAEYWLREIPNVGPMAH